MKSTNTTTESESSPTDHHVLVQIYPHQEPSDGIVVATGAERDCETLCESRDAAFDDVSHVVKPESFATDHDLNNVGPQSLNPEHAKDLASRFRN
ncbi:MULTISPECIES: hypothetical protein [Haloferacaceae]|uniref:Uncharacterized protein n=2 Tax=Haloferacaceae TaxID=1644056 RepID=A0ABD6DAT4_9EURY|nr:MULTISPECIES: hypothetical protein [Halorubraceae]